MKAIAAGLLVASIATAQNPVPKRSLESLNRHHRMAIETASRSEDPADYDKALAKYVTALREYLEHEAKGDEVPETRFSLVQALLTTGRQRAEAAKVLKKFDAGRASCLSCAQAAYLASTMRLTAQYEAWVSAALRKKATFSDRMELGVMLMSALRKPEEGEAIFAAALRDAKGDEAKATVLWHRARATREREDIPEDAYDEALKQLAEKFPETRHGGIAHDRLRAMEFKIGSDPIAFEVDTLDGKKFSPQKIGGQAVLVCFWSSEDPRSAEALKLLQDLHAQFGDRGLRVLGISLDATKSTAVAAATKAQTSFAQAWVPGEWDADLAMRYRVEDVPHIFLLDRKGKIAGMNFVASDKEGRQELHAAVVKVIGKPRE